MEGLPSKAEGVRVYRDKIQGRHKGHGRPLEDNKDARALEDSWSRNTEKDFLERRLEEGREIVNIHTEEYRQ